MKRRTLLLAALGGAAATGLALRPRDEGAPHQPYFEGLSSALDAAGAGTPRLLIDRQALHRNISTLRGHIGDRYAYRIVAKSLPSVPLLEEVMQRSGSNRLMLFHQPFINRVAAALPHADILLGKPMPVSAAARFYAQLGTTTFQPEQQLSWLLDTPQRVAQYAALAEQLAVDMRACIEIDVGLHRGGVQDDATLLAMLDAITAAPRLHFAGFMGYEPHVVKVPGSALSYRDRAMQRYSHFVAVAQRHLGARWPEDAILNCGGSPTYQLYDEGEFPFNELAAGSCLVKPTDFDIPTLADHEPAAFIAAPVLKASAGVQIPGLPLGVLQQLWNPNRRRTVFTYGGYWKAQPVSPAGLSVNPLFGRSTNQEMLNGSPATGLAADDWVFLRPTQSEFVFLQFGDIAVFDGGAIAAYWPVLGQQA
ncbi:DSD1 family PLP-dependent enzyme [Pseudohalioglobus sediminis]|uniref:DSD1 family PLP-dependent enzyme n=1 Tax=Pseudohalioglobus sediminis TaxID=2606449 RepID=A0A5B0X7A9_9GAMM|nr:DSD1 family PLP-dependent enzyme [Pseudohalioglobus sediminis]KAA1194119.1 DSD1 family PLP-dependent enzyme [Pseudohalioglobus sediminis]